MRSLSPENATYACVGALIDELVRSGVTSLCLAPGSRSAPLAISAARHAGMRVWTLIDERSMGFFALGMARASRRPVAVVTTSGTAAANLLPAVVEAHYGRVPLVLLTADRPREMRDAAAPQTIDQVRLYGSHVKWFVDAASPEATDARLRYYRATACRAAVTSMEAPAGPVHVNVPLREPLVPLVDPAMPPAAGRASEAWDGRVEGLPYAAAGPPARRPADPGSVRSLGTALARLTRGVIVAGPQYDPDLPAAVSRLAAATGFPVLADPLSQVRSGRHDRRFVIDSYDALLRVEEAVDALAPEIILRFGGVPASKPLLRYVERYAGARQILVDGDGWIDPAYVTSDTVRGDPHPWCDAVAAQLGTAGDRGHSPWVRRWMRLAEASRAAIRRRLEEMDEPFEGKAFAELSDLLPDGATLYVGNSMPVRDLDTFFAGTSRAIRVLGNRGASGIDGLVSSALGAAAASAPVDPAVPPGRVVLALGDLSFYHDQNGLLAASAHRLDATVVLLNNDGGGIFSFLPPAAYPVYFEDLFGTPTALEFRAAAQMYGAAFAGVATWPAFRDGIRAAEGRPGVSIVELRTTRDRNVTLHEDVWAGVRTAVRAELRRDPAGEASSCG